MKSNYLKCEYFQKMFLICIKNNDNQCNKYREVMINNNCNLYGFYLNDKKMIENIIFF